MARLARATYRCVVVAVVLVPCPLPQSPLPNALRNPSTQSELRAKNNGVNTQHARQHARLTALPLLRQQSQRRRRGQSPLTHPLTASHSKVHIHSLLHTALRSLRRCCSVFVWCSAWSSVTVVIYFFFIIRCATPSSKSQCRCVVAASRELRRAVAEPFTFSPSCFERTVWTCCPVLGSWVGLRTQ